MSKIPRFRVPAREKGATLIVALIFMAILALAGASVALNNTFQERMSGNTRSRDLAFQAAEAALDDAASTINTWRVLSFDGSQAGLTQLVDSQANDAGYWGNASNWASYRTPAQTLNQVAEQPRYRVEKMASVGTTEYYRVTARGVGAQASAIVVLQAVYSYTPSP